MLDRARYVSGLAGLLIVLAATHSLRNLADGGSPVEALLGFVVVSLPGVLLLYVGRWLSSAEIDDDLHSRIVAWALGGIGVMFVFLALRAVHPGVAASFTFAERSIALALGSVAGLAIGVHEARAITREREVRHRNEELQRTRAELEQAIRHLEASNEQLDQFASTASHDLREPLRMISRYLELIERRHGDAFDTEALEYLAFALDGADRLQAMVDDLLSYARIGTQDAPLEPVDLDAVFDQVRRDLQVSLEESDATITSDPLPRVWGDDGQLRQLFQNLLSNAVTYSGEEPPRIHVSADPGNSTCRLSVRDEGIGIEPAHQERIFGLFERLHTIDEHAGTGIGLATCRRIVEHHGGELWVDSEVEVGSTFSFTLTPVDAPSPAVPRIETGGS